MSKSRKPNDPFAKRESETYSNPIPSREFILQQLEQIGQPVGHAELCEQLELVGEEKIEALRRRLIAMSRDGQIISNRRGVYGLAAHMDLIKGRVQGNKDGFGFFIPDDDSDDFFLNGREMEKLFDGDRVLARLTGFDGRGRKEGTVVEILQRRYEQIVGRYYHDQGFGIVVPDSKRVPHEILIPDKQAGNAVDGQFVVAEITEYPSRRRKAIARIVEVLGDSGTAGLEIEVAVRSHDIPHEWPAPVKKEMTRFGNNVSEQDCVNRFDLRDIPFVTIDGEDAKDFDDAVFAYRHQRGNWTLYVAIADVSHYVAVSSALDEEAINRGTSVYFPGHVIPMLPEKLSNGLCSLKPKVDRLTMVCEMEISATGAMTDYSFYEAVIHSHGRMTYTEVADMVQPALNPTQEKLQEKLRKRHQSLVGHFENLHSLYKALHQSRAENGALDFDTTETRIVFGENKKIREIVPVERNDAHRLIEECMLCANVAAAQLLEEYKVPALYRIHEGPNPDKLENLREFLSELGLYLGGGEKPEPADYQQVLRVIGSRTDRHLLQTMLIRSMMQAVYQPENVGHFGLGFPAYAHFTSPIRRYPDLLVHRAIRFLLRNKSGPHLQKQANAPALKQKKIYPYSRSDMDSLGESCSAAERRADAASYNVIDWLKCEYMQDHVGDEFSGTVSSVTSFGLFVELTDIYIEGLVHISELSNDYYHFDPVRHCLEGERSHTVYRLGDTVQVKVVRVDLNDKKIDLQMLNVRSTGKTSGRPSRKKTRKGKSKKAGGRARSKAPKHDKQHKGRKAKKGGKKTSAKKTAPKKKAKPGKKVNSSAPKNRRRRR
jgi:ribonuclease R